MRLAIVLSLVVVVSGCMGRPVHTDPSSITDGEIAHYKEQMEESCRKQGTKDGEAWQKVEGTCACAVNVLNQALTREQWQKAAFAKQKDQHGDEQAVLAPHAPEIHKCYVGSKTPAP